MFPVALGVLFLLRIKFPPHKSLTDDGLHVLLMSGCMSYWWWDQYVSRIMISRIMMMYWFNFTIRVIDYQTYVHDERKFRQLFANVFKLIFKLIIFIYYLYLFIYTYYILSLCLVIHKLWTFFLDFLAK